MIESINGVVVIDKPVGPTSFDIVHQARAATGARKVGHGGTLDPLASGVLPICFGEATKLAQFLLDADKEYEATINFGAETDTYDAGGVVTDQRSAAHLREEEVRAALQTFLGDHSQVPPMYSALKRQGRPLYDYARAGETVDREARRVRIHRLELRAFSPASAAPATADAAPGTATPGPTASIILSCSKGTYVRSLAFDLGRLLGTGAHLGALRRTRSGPFSLHQAITPDQLSETSLPVISLAAALDQLPTVTVDEKVALALVHGKPVTWESAGPVVGRGTSDGGEGVGEGTSIRILSPGGHLLAVAPAGGPDSPIRTLRVFRGWEPENLSALSGGSAT